MPRFIAFTSRGLHDVLEGELHGLGITKTKKISAGVEFESNWEGCYRCNLNLRTATRVGLSVLDFTAYDGDELYNNIYKKHDFTKYNLSKGPIAVDAHVRESRFRDQRYVALKVKDAIVDQFRKKSGSRPDVSAKDPEMRVIVGVVKNKVSVAIDTSGTALFKRGYRASSVAAPLKEHVAASLVLLSNWTKEVPLIDPMCGSGTILIEAALLAMNIAPGTLRKKFAFQNFIHYKPEVWQRVVDTAIAAEQEELPFQLFGFDISSGAIRAAQANATAAGVADLIQFERLPVDSLEPPVEEGLIVTNPPYGGRLGSEELTKDIFRDFSFALKRSFKGWTCWLLSGNKEYQAAFKLKSSRKYLIYNGPIECRYLRYDIR